MVSMRTKCTSFYATKNTVLNNWKKLGATVSAYK